MRRKTFLARLAACAILCVSVPALVRADTIVLKNGRRIIALSVSVEGDKVRYETPSGSLTLPKSIVDHIEAGGAGMVSEAASNLPTSSPPLAALAFSDGEIEQKTVHQGSVDRAFVATLENEARSGSKSSQQAAAYAHHAAAKFEMGRGDIDHAVEDERTALRYVPQEPALLMNLAYLYLKRSEFKESLEYLERARRVLPDDPEVPKLAGWAYYGLNKIDFAVAEWKKSLAIRPDSEVKAALKKAERDKQEEESYKENESRHFTLRFSGAAEPALAKEILRTLEGHYEAISSELNYTTPEAVGVILYTRQAFSDITNAPNWAGALNDGRLRVPVQGLTSMTPDLSRVLKHELTHSFLEQMTHAKAPTWLHEGLAQFFEGKRSGLNAAGLLQIYDAKQGSTLGQLEGSWMHFSPNAVDFAYAWSLATIEAIVATNGIGDVVRILDHIAAGETPETAVQNVVRGGYGDLMEFTADYLRKTYVR